MAVLSNRGALLQVSKHPYIIIREEKLYLPQVLALELSGKTLTSRDSPTIQLFLVLQLRYCTSLKSGYLSGSFPRMP